MTAATVDEAKARRGRPMGFDRDAAVRAAMEALWKRGYEAMSASDLADAMSIRRSSFYNSFGSREAVFRDALAAYRRIAPDAALAEVKPGQPVKPAIRKVFREICRVRGADPQARGCLVVNAIGELVGVHAELSGSLEQAVLASVRAYERLLRQAAEQGEIPRPKDIRATARAFAAFVSGLNTLSKIIRDEGKLWRMCESFLGLYGLGAESKPV